MWRINALNVIHLGRTPGGEIFTEFVDALIRAQAHVGGLDASKIRTNLRVNIPDGGIDTEVVARCAGDTSGWLRDHATVFQYKAREVAGIQEKDLVTEIHKPYSEDCIRNGHAYRFCVCDSVASEKKAQWENILTREAREINRQAPEAKVLSADDLAAWACQLPAVALRYFKPRLADICLYLEAWGQTITETTPKFVSVPAHHPIQERIMQHVDFTIQPAEVVFSISGEAGVGKTRLAYESLVSLEQAHGLVVYTNDDEKAIKVATLLVNDKSQKAILVADECGVKARVKLNSLLDGAKARVRVINIDNSGERPSSEAPEYWMEKIPKETVEKILEENYPHVPGQRRRAYSSLSGGFVRLAADLCRHDDLAAASRSIWDYIRSRLTKEEQQVLLGLSLVTRVGMKQDVEEQLEELCSLIRVEVSEFRETADRLHDSPGFVSKGGRFYYVTPEIIAQIAFDKAWNKWAKDDVESFVHDIPQSLLQVFMKRVAKSARKEVRRTVGEFFQRWASLLNPGELSSVTVVDWLVTLIELTPDTYLSTLRRLVEEATTDELSQVTGDSIQGRWGPRRALVWLAEKIGAFPEHFDDAENILLRLALAESEPTIGNNATAQWGQLFWIALSGTALPFSERLERLEQRILSDSRRVSSLGLQALGQLLGRQHWRMVGPAVVAGRVPPEEWKPKTNAEYRACMDRVVMLLQKLIGRTPSPKERKEEAQYIIINNARFLLSSGYLEQMKTMFPEETLSDEVRIRLTENIQDFLHYDVKEEGDRPGHPAGYVTDVTAWLSSLEPSDFHGRLVSLVGVEPWHHRLLEDEQTWMSHIHSLAVECLKDQSNFKEEIEWLCSPIAKSASYLGHELGKIDAEAELLEFVVESSLRLKSAELARLYITGLVTSFPQHITRVNEEIDRIQEKLAELAYELFMGGGDLTNSLQRTLHLVDTGRLPVTYLRGFAFGCGAREVLSGDEMAEVLRRLLAAIERGDSRARSVAIQFISFQITRAAERSAQSILARLDLQTLVWRLVEVTSADVAGQSYAWIKIIEQLIHYNALRAIRITAFGLVGDDLNHRKACEKLLIKFGKARPEIVMNSLGRVMLDDRQGWKLYIDVYRSLVQSLSLEAVVAWLNEQGVKGARVLARHLPIPFVDTEGKPVVPPLTEFVLKTFEDDERVFREFVAGSGTFRMYSGDIAAQHEKEAETAREFLNHPLKRIRQWAEAEMKEARWEAERWRQMDEERFLE